ncbi:MAG: nucleoside hydrolase, partial [bacterium]|nr:nucleoside hydrolase [Candidatus Colisoma equi]
MKCELLALAVGILALGAQGANEDPFAEACPIWVAGRSGDMNLMVGFRGDFTARTGDRVTLRVTGATVYRAFVNGMFAGYGPARAAKGFFRVDEWDVTELVRTGANAVAIEVSSYNVKNYYQALQRPFLQAEVVVNGKVAMATPTGFGHVRLLPRVRKCSRYSFQRGFAEVYELDVDSFAWRTGRVERTDVPLENCPSVRYLRRRVEYPQFERSPVSFSRETEVRFSAVTNVHPHWYFDLIPRFGLGYSGKELDFDVNATNQSVTTVANRPVGSEPGRIGGGRGVLLGLGGNRTGFLSATVTVSRPGLLGIMFDEALMDGKVMPTDVDGGRGLSVANGIYFRFREPGTYHVESFEPSTLQWAHAFALEGGEMTLSDLSFRNYRSPSADGFRFARGSDSVRRIFEAGRETFAQNAVDVLSDCPSRERAGWLADSFFSARTSWLLTGSRALEDLFIENFAVADGFEPVPDGMLPMCYPADFADGDFIPNWAMWFVLQIDDYVRNRRGDPALVARLRPRLQKLIRFLWQYRNADGLLEKLPRWVFVEWSKANELVQDVNYPSNMLWAEALEAMDRLYGMPELAAEAKRVRATVTAQSWNGEWFCDNAVRQADGSLKVTGERTEVCQYYAFFFGLATPAGNPILWKRLVEDFGPSRKQTGKWKEIWPADAFFGNYLRLEILSREGRGEQVVDEIAGYFGGMADRTGTLWEYNRPTASLCHGFASYVTVLLDRHVPNPEPVKVIFDTDMICDFDDVGALACLHALADAGECEILATVSCTRGNASVAAIEVINGYYGRAGIPVGCVKGEGILGEYPGATKKVDPKDPIVRDDSDDGGHAKFRQLAADYPHWVRHLDADEAPDATEVYRRTLASAPDRSVVICSVGFLTNLRKLLESKPDGISPLDGRSLVAQKVKRWVAMACSYPTGKECNSMCDAASSRVVLESWPTPAVFSDFQYGFDIYTGRALAERPGSRNPVKDVFVGNIPPLAAVRADPAAWARRCYGVGGRSSWDETA